jgi:hypothetical protein
MILDSPFGILLIEINLFFFGRQDEVPLLLLPLPTDTDFHQKPFHL